MDGATTPQASPTRITSRPLSQRFIGFSGIGAPSRRSVSQSASPVRARSSVIAPLRLKPLLAVPVPTLIVAPCGKTHE